MVDNSKWSRQLRPHWIGIPSSSTPLLRCELVATMNLTLKVEDFVWEPFFFVVPAFVVPCCFNERVPCSRPRMARSTRRSKPDQRGAETLGGLPAQLHAIRKVGFDQLVRENACKDTRCGRPSCLFPLEGLESPILFCAAGV